jgi:hypothetical protein
MPKVHDFNEKLAKTIEPNAAIDAYFEPIFWVDKKVPREVDLIGIDRYFVNKKYNGVFGIEYKCDERAHDTGNAFVEYEANDKTKKLGWGLSCRAQYIAYYIPQEMRGWLMNAVTIKIRLVEEWLPKMEQGIYEKRPAKNATYNSWGVCVPLADFTRTGVWLEFSTAKVIQEMKNGRSESTDSTTE